MKVAIAAGAIAYSIRIAFPGGKPAPGANRAARKGVAAAGRR
jgi:hypothetical protein